MKRSLEILGFGLSVSLSLPWSALAQRGERVEARGRETPRPVGGLTRPLPRPAPAIRAEPRIHPAPPLQPRTSPAQVPTNRPENRPPVPRPNPANREILPAEPLRPAAIGRPGQVVERPGALNRVENQGNLGENVDRFDRERFENPRFGPNNQNGYGPDPFGERVLVGRPRRFGAADLMNAVVNQNNGWGASYPGPVDGWYSPYYSRHVGWYRGPWNGGLFGGGRGLGGFGLAALGNIGRLTALGLGGGAGNIYGPGYASPYGPGFGVYSAMPTWGGYALSPWGLGGWGSGWLYSDYSNPYLNAERVVVQQPVYDYSRPIDIASAPPSAHVESRETALFDSARNMFKAGRYAEALDFTNQALKETPNDPALHEFRALALFALGRYDDAAVALYAVLTAGPGWNWSTMIGLYGDADVYTTQLRALEAAVNQNRGSAPLRFVLAYHYMVQGHAADARRQFQHVVELQPKDELAKRFVQLLGPSPSAPKAGLSEAAEPNANGVPNGSTTAAPASPRAVPPPPELIGTWKAHPQTDSTIVLTLKKDGGYSWDFNDQGKTRSVVGQARYLDGVLSLVQDQGPPLAGKIENPTAAGFGFKLLGAENAPILKFSK